MMKLLWAQDHALKVLSKRMERALRITGPQRLVLKVVKGNPRISAGALAQYLHIDPSTLTGVVQRLERRRLLRRLADPTDARRVQLEVTARGSEYAALQVGTVEVAVLRAMRGLPTESLQGAQAFFNAMIAELEREGRAPGKTARRTTRRRTPDATIVQPQKSRPPTRARSSR